MRPSDHYLDKPLAVAGDSATDLQFFASAHGIGHTSAAMVSHVTGPMEAE